MWSPGVVPVVGLYPMYGSLVGPPAQDLVAQWDPGPVYTQPVPRPFQSPRASVAVWSSPRSWGPAGPGFPEVIGGSSEGP